MLRTPAYYLFYFTQTQNKIVIYTHTEQYVQKATSNSTRLTWSQSSGEIEYAYSSV